jgi:hypothetical protein
MAQHDYILANQSGAAFRSDLNNGLAAIVSQNSGAAQPSTTYAYQWWADTATGLLKISNAANNAWITLFQLDGEWTTLALENGTAAAPSLYFKDSGTDTGLFSPGANQLAISTGGVQRLLADASGNLTASGGLTVANLNGGPLAGTRNRIINGDMRIDQRNAGAAVTVPASTVTYTADRWYVFTTGSTLSVQSLGGQTGVSSNYLRATGAAGNTNAIFGHRIEASNCTDLAGLAATVTLSWYAASSTQTSMNYSVQYANSTNNFGSVTAITSGSQSITSTLTRYSVTFAVPGGAFTGLQIELALTSFTSGTFDLTGVQLETGTVATPFERRSYGQELALCQRYFELLGTGQVGGWLSASACSIGGKFASTKRATPSITLLNASPQILEVGVGAKTGSGSSLSSVIADTQGIRYDLNGFSSATNGKVAIVQTMSLSASSEL